MKTRQKYAEGFTLIEMLVAIALFSIIMVMAVGSLLSIIDANRQAQVKKTVVNNLHFALENMTRNIRTGRYFHCDIEVGDITAPRDCANAPATSFAFLDSNGKRIEYRQNGAVIERLISGDANFIGITAPEVTINQLRFFVSGAEAEDATQPRVLIVLDGVMQGRARTPSVFNIETLVSQRLLDI